MFSLIIAIVSIALVVALVVVGGFYGGSSMLDSQARTAATRLKTEEQQILGAVDLFKADNRRWPTDMNELVSRNYLRSLPQGVQSASAGIELVSSAHAQDAALGWSSALAGQPIFVTAVKVPRSVCRHYNFASRGDDGILRAPYSDLQAQCYGADGHYRVVVKKTGVDVASLRDALGGVVLDGGLPAGDGGDAWWDIAPEGDVKGPLDPEKTPTALLTLSSTSFDFGAIPAGSASTARTLTLTNTGNRELTGLGGYSAPEGFAIEGNSCASTLAVAASCSMDFVFSPEALTDYEGTVSFASSSAQAAAITLRGAATMVALSSNISWVQNIGVGPANARHYARYVLTNEGNRPVDLKSLKVTEGEGFAAGDTCVLGSPLAAGASCTVDVGFSASQDASANLSVGAVLSTSAGDKALSVSGSSTQLSWELATAPERVVPGQANPYLLRLKNNAPTSFLFGGGNASQGKFNVTGAEWAVTATSCGASLPGGGVCDATLAVTPSAAEVDRPVTIAPVGALHDYVNRTEAAGIAAPKELAAYSTAARATRVDFSSLVASMVNPTVAQGTTDATAGAYFSLAQGGATRLQAGTWSVGRTVTVPDARGTIKAKLRYIADDRLAGLVVNGQSVATPTGPITLQESSEFTLLPGVNSITWSYTNDGGPGQFAVQVINTSDSSIVAPSSGWQYAGAAVPIAIFKDGAVSRYANGGIAESCQAYRWPAAGYAIADTDGQYRVLGGSATVYCDMTHNDGGWTLVMTNNVYYFTNRSGTGTGTICLAPNSCNTGGTSNVYVGTPVAAKISQYMFTATNNGDVWSKVLVLDRPANFIRDNTPYPGRTLYSLMTDAALGWAPAESGQGDLNESARKFKTANGNEWSDGNWQGKQGVQAMQALSSGFGWGHHHYSGDAVMENGMVKLASYTYMPFHGDAGNVYLTPHQAENLYRWTAWVR